ncbi:hypothetical protein KIW84_052177 [Lathyrus oleraceus]|uniref:Uncharacterized protein n=1 Tax=Pisum sativum TaxID=3888 RepID=A0A9D4WM05_PEA|nr:hypothetical protein KIW84_052177 [Pisum sativum]
MASKIKNSKYSKKQMSIPHAHKILGPKVINVDPEPTAKNPERIESDNSSPGVDALKDGTDGTEQSSIKHVIPGNSNTHLHHPLSNKDSNKGSTSEVNKPADKQQEVSPPKNTTQHSQTTGSDSEDGEEKEHHLIDIPETIDIQNPKENVQDKTDDSLPKILNQGEDVLDKEEDEDEDEDHSMFDIPIDPLEEEEDESQMEESCDGESEAMLHQPLNIDLPSSSDIDVSSMVSMKEGCESPFSSWDSEPENDISPKKSLQDTNLEGNSLDVEENNRFVGVENVDDGFLCEVDNRSYDELLKKFIEKEEELRVSNLKLQLSEQEIVKLEVQAENREIQINDVCEKLELKEEELNEQKKLLEEEIFKNVTEQLEAAHKKLKISTDEVEVLRKELGIKSSMNNQLQCQIKEEKRNRYILENLVMKNDDDNINHKEELRKLNGSLADSRISFFSEKKQLTLKLEDCEARNKVLEQKVIQNEVESLNHFKDEIRYLRKRLAERKNELEAANRKSEKVMIEIDEANVKIDKLKAEICSRDDEISDMKKCMNEISASREELVVDYKAKLNEENELQLRVDELEETVIDQNGVIWKMAEEKKEAIRELCNSLEHYKSGYNEVMQAYESLYASRGTHCFSFLV